jgi:putative mRNA 3-end processing factor
MGDLLQLTELGLWCKAGNFYIDPVKKVSRAIITHAHGDHARNGMESYLCSKEGYLPLKYRLAKGASIQPLAYNEYIYINGLKVSLHPAGHILGSSQIRVEYQGEVWVVSGDYKLGGDSTCSPFEPVKCDTFISECTFGLPKYIWKPPQETFDEINDWWKQNANENICSVIFAYSLGKAQRILSGLDESIGSIYTHNTIKPMNDIYIQSGIELPNAIVANKNTSKDDFSKSIVIAPPLAQHSIWLKYFGTYKTAFASGWMGENDEKRREHIDKGFELSDHADWPSLNQAIKATACERVIFTHGYAHEMAEYYKSLGYQSEILIEK